MPPPGGSFGQINFSGGPLGIASGQAQLFDPGQAAGMTDAYDRAADSAAKLKREIAQLKNLQNQLQRDMAGANRSSDVYANKARELDEVNKKIDGLSVSYKNAQKAQSLYEKGMPNWAKHETSATKYLGSLERQALGVKNLIANNKELQLVLGGVALASGAVTKTFKFAIGIIQKLYNGIKTTTEFLLTAPVKIGEFAGKMGNSIRQELVEVIGQAVENTKEFFDLSSNGGSAMSRLGEIASGALGSFQSVNSSLTKLFGFGSQGASNMIQQLSQGINSMGVFGELFAKSTTASTKSIEFFQRMTKGLGMSAEDTKYIVLEAVKNGEHYFETMTRVKESADAASKEFGINRKRLSMGFFELRKDIVQFGHLTEPQLMRVVGRATQLGVEVKELSAVFGKFDTFESAAQSAAMLQQTFGMNIDALKLIKAEDPMEIVEMFRQSMMMTGRSFDDLNRHEKSLMASHTGMSAEALKTIMNYRNVGKSYEEIKKQMNDQKPEERQIKAMKDMNSSISEVKKTIEGKGFFANFLDGVTNTIKYNSKLGRTFVQVNKRMEDFYEKGLSLSKKQRKQMDAIFRPFTKILDELIGPKGAFSKDSFDKLKDGVLKNLSEFVDDVFGDDSGKRMNISYAQRTWEKKIKGILSIEGLMDDQSFIGKIFRASGKIIGKIVRGLIVAVPVLAEGFAQVVDGGLSAVSSFLGEGNTGFQSSILGWLGFDPTKNAETTAGITRAFRKLKTIFIGKGQEEGLITRAFNKLKDIAASIGSRIVDGFNNNKGAIMELTDNLSFGFFNKFMMFASRSPLFSKLISEDAAEEAGRQYTQGTLKRYTRAQAAAAILDENKFGDEIGSLADEGQHALGGSVGEYVKHLASTYQSTGGATGGHYIGGKGQEKFVARFLEAQTKAAKANRGDVVNRELASMMTYSADMQRNVYHYAKQNKVIQALFGGKKAKSYTDFVDKIEKAADNEERYTIFLQEIRKRLVTVAAAEDKRLTAITKVKNAASALAQKGASAGATDDILSSVSHTLKGQVLGVGPNADPNTNVDGKMHPGRPDDTSTTYSFSQKEVKWKQRERYLEDEVRKGYSRAGNEFDTASGQFIDAPMKDGKFEGLNFTTLSSDLLRRISEISADERMMGRELGISKKDLEILMTSQDDKIIQLREEYLRMVGTFEGQKHTVITIDGYEIAAIIDKKKLEADTDPSRLGSAGKTSRSVVAEQ